MTGNAQSAEVGDGEDDPDGVGDAVGDADGVGDVEGEADAAEQSNETDAFTGEGETSWTATVPGLTKFTSNGDGGRVGGYTH